MQRYDHIPTEGPQEVFSRSEKWPYDVLSNFHPRIICFRGVRGYIEGILQALLYGEDGEEKQREICEKFGIEAKRIGEARRLQTVPITTLTFMGKTYQRNSLEYQLFLREIYTACLNQDPLFGRALLATGNAIFTHEIGLPDPTQDVMTRQEFTDCLTEAREQARLRARIFLSPFA